jgi:fatty acid desaturase
LNKHNTHHVAPNIHGQDPDLDTMPFLAWSEDALELFSDYSDDTLAKLWISHQPILFFPLFVLVRLAWTMSSIAYPLYGNVKTSVATLEICGIALHYTWQFGLAILWLGPRRALIYFILSQALGGILLASVFVLNHNGRAVLNKNDLQTKGFYELQIYTSRNVRSTPLLDWIMGGLNYQIEHHLFPTLPRHNYHLVAPLVKEVCAKHQVHYHETTFWQGMMEVLGRLRSVGKLAENRL